MNLPEFLGLITETDEEMEQRIKDHRTFEKTTYIALFLVLGLSMKTGLLLEAP